MFNPLGKLIAAEEFEEAAEPGAGLREHPAARATAAMQNKARLLKDP